MDQRSYILPRFANNFRDIRNQVGQAKQGEVWDILYDFPDLAFLHHIWTLWPSIIGEIPK